MDNKFDYNQAKLYLKSKGYTISQFCKENNLKYPSKPKQGASTLFIRTFLKFRQENIMLDLAERQNKQLANYQADETVLNI